MRGVLSHAGYVPYRRLDRSTIGAVAGSGGGTGERSVASYDEDTTTMAVEAARLALRASPERSPAALYFATTAPAYVDKTNATAIHATLRLPLETIAADSGGATRSAVAALRSALAGDEATLVVAADIRTGLPGGPDEAAGGDAASAFVVGEGAVIAEYLGAGSATEEFLDRWRSPGEPRSKLWEERFGEGKYVALGDQAWAAALKRTGLSAGDVTRLVVAGSHARAVAEMRRRLPAAACAVQADTAESVGWTGAAHPGLLLSMALEEAGPGEIIALVSLADGADVLLFRTTAAIAGFTPARPLVAQIEAKGTVAYGKFLTWRGMLPVEPARRPEPARVSASAAGRSVDWKFGFVGSRSDAGAITMPPSVPGAGGDLEPAAMADVQGTIATFTVDRLAYSPSPPVVFAVVDFDGGGRLPVELTDVDERDVSIGDRVEPTFRRLSTADGIHNYFWKVRPVRGGDG